MSDIVQKRSVVYVTNVSFPEKGMACANRMLSIGKGLVKLGHRVQILTSKSDRGICEEFIIDGVNIRCCTHRKYNEKVYQHFFRFLTSIFRYLKTNQTQIDAVIVYSYYKPLNVALYLITSLLRLHYVAEKTEIPVCMISPRPSWLRQWVEEFLEFRVMPKMYDGMIIITKTLVSFYERKVRRCCKIIHVPMTVDRSRFGGIGAPPVSPPYIAYCGTMRNSKDGVLDLITSFQSIAKEFPKIKLVLIGYAEEDDLIELNSAIRDCGISDRIHYIGHRSRTEIPKLIKGARILVLPRPDSHQAQAGFPTKLGEYLCTGNPVVATRVGELSDYLTDRKNVYLVTPGNTRELSDVLCEILNNYEEACAVGRAGMNVAAENFECCVQAKRIELYLRELVQCLV